MKKILLFHTAICLLLAGCATAPVVESTPEELSAARPFKKTVAIIGFNESGSPLKGVRLIAVEQLEKILAGRFNLVDRGRVKEVMAGRDPVSLQGSEGVRGIGKLLGVDYMIFGDIHVTAGSHRLKSSQYRDRNGKFSGNIWEENDARSEISLRIVDAKAGEVIYAGKKSDYASQRIKERAFNDENAFKQGLERNSAIEQQLLTAFVGLADMGKENAYLVSKVVNGAAQKFNQDLRQIGAVNGEVIQIISENSILVNLGSAYGIRPGDRMTVLEKVAGVQDPKTGMVINQRQIKAKLRVVEVSSGLSSVAKGRQKDIENIKIGDAVYTE